LATAQRPWWIAYAVCIVALLILDRTVAAWNPSNARLPEAFSAAYLDRQADDLRSDRRLVVFLGDSVLWGYKLKSSAIATALLSNSLPGRTVANLSYEGGSPVNSEFMLRYLLARGVHPALLVINVNLKEFNPLDSSYKRLRPALEIAGASLLDASDRRNLDLTERTDFSARANRFVERYWMLYRYRIDLRQRFLGFEDFSSWLAAQAQRITGYTGRYDVQHRPTPDRFLGTYDLTPLDRSNLAFVRLTAFCDLAKKHGIRVLAVLTPTNHALLHDYIDNSDYTNNLSTVKSALVRHGALVIDADRRFTTRDFLDNDHLSAGGNASFARLLLRPVDRASR
jgi:hypothetical protein